MAAAKKKAVVDEVVVVEPLAGTPVESDTQYAPREPNNPVAPVSDESGPDHEAAGRTLPGTPA